MGGAISSVSSISWHAPTTYVDQTPLSLSAIGGYHIYVGTDADHLQLIADIPDSSVTEFSLSEVGKGTRYIAVTCYDTSGIESAFSHILIVDII